MSPEEIYQLKSDASKHGLTIDQFLIMKQTAAIEELTKAVNNLDRRRKHKTTKES